MFTGWTISCDENTSDITGLSSVIEGDVQLINRLWAEGIQAFWSIESDSHGTLIFGPVIGNVCEVESGDNVPMVYLEWIV